MLYCNGDFFSLKFNKSQEHVSTSLPILEPHITLLGWICLVYFINEQKQCVLGNFSSGTLGLFGFKVQQFNFSLGEGVGISKKKKKNNFSHRFSTQPTNFLLCFLRPASLRLTLHHLPTCNLQTPSVVPFDVMFALMYSRG